MRIFAFILCLISAPAFAQGYLPLTTTPDISISATATADFAIPGRAYADWFAIKNDCTSDLYFAPRNIDKSALDYPLRLGAGESFSAPFRIYSLGVSNDGASACTFTFQPAISFGP